MGGIASILYGVAVYGLFLGTFLYAVGFVSRLVVPKTINTGPTSSLPTALLIVSWDWLSQVSLAAASHLF